RPEGPSLAVEDGDVAGVDSEGAVEGVDPLVGPTEGDQEFAPGAPRPHVVRVPLQGRVVPLQGVLAGPRGLEDMGLSIPQARVPVVDRQRLVKAAEGAVVLLRGFMDGGLPRPCLDAVRGDPEGAV